MYKFLHDYVKPKYGDNTTLCYMDTDSFIVHVKTDYIYRDIAEGDVLSLRYKSWYSPQFFILKPLETLLACM